MGEREQLPWKPVPTSRRGLQARKCQGPASFQRCFQFFPIEQHEESAIWNIKFLLKSIFLDVSEIIKDSLKQIKVVT